MSWLERRALVKILGGGNLVSSELDTYAYVFCAVAMHTGDCRCLGMISRSARSVPKEET